MTSDAPAEWDDEPAPAAATSDVPQLFFGSVDEFVREKLRYTYIRRVSATGAYRWSAEWWKFPEAISRLDSLWRAWEALRLDGTFGMSVWWRDHADHHMRMLMAPDGPFANSRDSNEVDPTLAAKALVGKTMGERPIGPLPYTAPPPGMFVDVRNLPG